DLKDHDFSVSPRCGLLHTRAGEYRFSPEVHFNSHAPGGMSSTMCFNRRFAEQLLVDITHDRAHHYADNVVARVTMPRFRCLCSQRYTEIYPAAQGSVTSRDWLRGVFGEAE